MKTNVMLGCLSVLVEADDYQELVRQAWQIAKLNEAVSQEGHDPSEWIPYCETGTDGHEYAGFSHLKSNKRIRLGKLTSGDWYVRWKGSENYKGFEEWGNTPNQLPAHEEVPKVEGKAKREPANGRQQDQRSEQKQEGELTPDQMIGLLRKMLEDAYQGGPAHLRKGIAAANKRIGTFPSGKRGEVKKMVKEYEDRLKKMESIQYHPNATAPAFQDHQQAAESDMPAEFYQ